MAAAKARRRQVPSPEWGEGITRLRRKRQSGGKKRADDQAAALRPIIDAIRAEGITGLKEVAAALNER